MEQTETLEIVTVEKASEKELVKVNPLKIELNELKEKYKDADIKDFSDKEGYDLCKSAVKDFRTHKTKSEAKRKEHKFFFIEMGKIIDKNYNEVIEDAGDQQETFDKKVKDYEEEKQRVKKEKEEAKQRVWLERSAKLTALNALYSDDHFILGDAIVKKDMVISLDDTVFAEVLKGFQEAHDKIEAEAKEQERLKQEAAEKLRQEQAELKMKQEEFDRKQREFEEKQEALRKQQEEIERRERQREEEEEKRQRWAKAEEERKKQAEIEKRLNARYDQLISIGMIFSGHYGCFVFEDINVDNNTEVNLLDDAGWNALIEKITPVIAERKAEAEKKRLDAIEKQKAEKEKEMTSELRKQLLSNIRLPHFDKEVVADMSELEWESFYNEAKSDYEEHLRQELAETERVKKLQEQEREKERLADLSENKRWREWVEKKLIPFMADIPTFESKRYVRARGIATEKMEEIISMKPGNF